MAGGPVAVAYEAFAAQPAQFGADGERGLAERIGELHLV
jgi:hypothetical protein